MSSGNSRSVSSVGGVIEGQRVVSGTFRQWQAAESAIEELRDLGVAAEFISVISREEDQPGGQGAAGASREVLGDEALAYRASPELPNYEDLPTTVAEQTGTPLEGEVVAGSVSVDGGGLSHDEDLVRRNEAETNADVDIYTDFPDKPGGVNPDSPVAAKQEGTVQQEANNRTPAVGTAATGAAIGGLGGLLVGLGVLAVPGIGPILAAGPLAGALGGILAGGAAGGVIGGLSAIGVPEEYARDYAARIEQGHTLISVRTDEVTADPVERILTVNGAENVHCD
ncbi:MAG: hypothetical protein QOH93_181 [Chloroflexia bacterium]|jgi:uncharacterized membrane protein|nr:hypothetical protein [Chloroflexia bacterium]